MRTYKKRLTPTELDDRSHRHERCGISRYSRQFAAARDRSNCLRDDWFWLVTAQIEKEYRDVLARPKFDLSSSIQNHWLAFIEAATIRFDAQANSEFARDAKDAPFVAAALASEADYLITGDKDFSEAQSLVICRILTVSEFARTFSIA